MMQDVPVKFDPGTRDDKTAGPRHVGYNTMS
jgi:hypothetical protein